MSSASPTVYLAANGDLRLAANQQCWAEQEGMECRLAGAVSRFGRKLQRAHPFDPIKRHGFIDSQKMGLAVFEKVDPAAPLIVAEAVWQYSQHLLPGLSTHRGPILTVANWSGRWPGLVGLLNLNASLSKMGIPYSTLWSENFTDPFFRDHLRQWLAAPPVRHDQSHVRDFALLSGASAAEEQGRRMAREFRRRKAILGIFDEGCMGMHNAIIPDELLNPTGVFKERLSQSALFAEMLQVTDAEAQAVYRWLLRKGMRFDLGTDDETDLTEAQVLGQARMYIAAGRLADAFGCSSIGIQYQQGLKDLTPASDLAEGLFNNRIRPPITSRDGRRTLFAGEALPHFNEVDECAGLDGLITYQLWRALGLPPENTLHDLRWGEVYPRPGRAAVDRRPGQRKEGKNGRDPFVWVFLISGAAPPAHFIGGFRGATSQRQPPIYFRLGGGTLKGVSKPGHIVWSRIFVLPGKLHCDLGVAEVLRLPEEETERRWRLTTPQWPIMHVDLKGITRDQMMGRHKSNHIQVVYAGDDRTACRALRTKAAFLAELGIEVHICGDVEWE